MMLTAPPAPASLAVPAIIKPLQPPPYPWKRQRQGPPACRICAGLPLTRPTFAGRGCCGDLARRWRSPATVSVSPSLGVCRACCPQSAALFPHNTLHFFQTLHRLPSFSRRPLAQPSQCPSSRRNRSPSSIGRQYTNTFHSTPHINKASPANVTLHRHPH